MPDIDLKPTLPTDDPGMAHHRAQLALERTRLANKRTFLAWCRTTLAFMGFGFLLEKIDYFVSRRELDMADTAIRELGLLGEIAFVVGPLLLLFAGWRYYRLEKSLGFSRDGLWCLPEALLFIVIFCAALIYLCF